MQNIINIVRFLGAIDSNKSLAGIVAGAILGGVILICVLALVFKKMLLNRKYKEDEEYVKEYRKNLQEKEKNEKTEKEEKDATVTLEDI